MHHKIIVDFKMGYLSYRSAGEFSFCFLFTQTATKAFSPILVLFSTCTRSLKWRNCSHNVSGIFLEVEPRVPLSKLLQLTYLVSVIWIQRLQYRPTNFAEAGEYNKQLSLIGESTLQWLVLHILFLILFFMLPYILDMI